MSIGTLMIVFAVMLAITFGYYALNKERFKKMAEADGMNNPDIVKVACWININKVNGKDFDPNNLRDTKVKNGMFNRARVAFFEPGDYTLVVSSNSNENYQNVEMKVKLDPSVFYQLGCNDEGVYLVEDPNPARYK